MKLRLAEEIVLLTLHDGGGKFANVKDWPLRCALAGGILMDLILERRMDAEPQTLRVLDAEPLGVPLLDPALAEMAADDQARTPRYWVDHFAQKADRLRTEALENLVERGILRHESGLFHWVHGSRRYPTSVEEVEVKLRVLGVLLEGEEPGPRDIALVHLAHACHILRPFLKHALYQQAEKRIEEVCLLDEAGAAVLDAIMDSEVAAGPSHGRPSAAKLPVVGNLRVLLRDDHFLMPKLYAELGPVFRLSVFGREITVMAGSEASRFFAKHDNRYLRPFERRHDMDICLGGMRSVLSAGGEEHARLRRQFQPAFSYKYTLSRTSDIVAVARRHLASWPTRTPVPAMPTLSLLVTEMQHLIFDGMPSDGSEEEWIRFGYEVKMNNMRAIDARNSEKFKKACQRMHALIQHTIEGHRLQAENDAEPNFIARLMALHEEDPIFMPEADLHTQIGIMNSAGTETVTGSVAFMLHALFENPDLMEQATAEADALFANGLPTPEAVKEIDILRRTHMEALRIWPVVFLVGRVVANSFDFGGYRFSAGEHIDLCIVVPHLLEEFYPDPGKFDIDRYLPERMEHAAPGAYAPYGQGSRSCLGAGMARVQVPLIVAALLHGARLEAGDPKHKMKIKYLPFMRPDDSFTMRIRERR